MNGVCCHKEVPFRQLFVDLVGRHVQPIKDPIFHEALVSGGLDWVSMAGKHTVTTSYLQSRAGNEIRIEFEHSELRSVEDLVTELSVPFHAKDLEVNVTAYRSDSQQTASVRTTSDRTSRRVRAKRKPHGITPAFRDALGEVLLLASLCLSNLFVVQITLMEFLVERLEIYSLNDVDWVDDVPKGFAHLPSVCISNHRMAVHLLERHLVGQFDAQEYHPCHPEE